MPALSSPSTWRSHPQWLRGWLYIHIPDSYLEGTITQSSFTYPITQLTYSNTSGSHTAVQPNATVRVKDSGGNFKGYCRVSSHNTTTASTLYIGVVGQGEIDFAQNDTFEVLEDFRIWTKTPFIDGNGVQFMDYDQTYSSAVSMTPVANAGPYYAARHEGTDIEVDFDATGSYSLDGSVLSYSWDFDDGTPSSAATSTVSDVSFPAGSRWVKLTVTGNGKTHTTRVLVATPATPYQAVLTSLSGSIDDGWRANFRLLKDDVSDVPEGAIVIFWADESYNDTLGGLNGFADREQVKFVGYIESDGIRIEPFSSDVDISCISAVNVMQQLPAYPTTYERESSPTSWFEIADLDWWRYTVALLQRYSTALEVCDFVRPSFYADYDVLRLNADGGTQQAQMQFAAQAMSGRFTCDKQGRLYIRRYPSLMDSTERTANTTTLTLTDEDWTDLVQVQRRYRDPVSFVLGSGIIGSASEVAAALSAAPGELPGQGTAQETLDRQLVENQAELNQRTGDFYAWRNNDFGQITITVLNQGLVADPAWLEWIKFTLSSSSNKAALGFDSNDRFILQSVQATYDWENGTSLEQWALEKETDGVDGITKIVPDNEVPGSDGFNDQPPIEFNPPPFWIPPPFDNDGDEPPEEMVGGCIAWTESNILYCEDVYAESPAWVSIYTGKTNSLRGGFIRFDSPGLATPGGAIKMWIIEGQVGQPDSGFWYNPDALGSGSWTQYGTTGGFARMRGAYWDYDLAVFYDDEAGGEVVLIDVYNGTTVADSYSIASSAAAETGIDISDFSSVPFAWFARNSNTLTLLDNLSSGSDADVDFSGVGGNPTGIIKAVRTPYRIWLDNSLNNTQSAIDVAVATEQAFYLCTINATNTASPSATFKVDRTPVIGGANYGPSNADGFEMRGGNPNYIAMAAFEDGGSGKHIIVAEDGGQNWNSVDNGRELDVVHWAGKESFWACGEDGLYQFTELGANVFNRTGNIFDKSTSQDIRGFTLIA